MQDLLVIKSTENDGSVLLLPLPVFETALAHLPFQDDERDIDDGQKDQRDDGVSQYARQIGFVTGLIDQGPQTSLHPAYVN